MSNPVVIEYPTIMDGTVVRWYRTENAAKYGGEILSASRNGVRIPEAISQADKQLVDRAFEIHERLAATGRGQHADLSDVVTHTKAFLGHDIALVKP